MPLRSKHFPTFDDFDLDGDLESDTNGNGPMKIAQLVECAQIMSVCEQNDVVMGMFSVFLVHRNSTSATQT